MPLITCLHIQETIGLIFQALNLSVPRGQCTSRLEAGSNNESFRRMVFQLVVKRVTSARCHQLLFLAVAGSCGHSCEGAG